MRKFIVTADVTYRETFMVEIVDDGTYEEDDYDIIAEMAVYNISFNGVNVYTISQKRKDIDDMEVKSA